MSRTTVVRRLTGVLALVAVLCLALPAAAATGARHQSPPTPVVHTPGLLDQLLSWLGTLLPGLAAQTSRMEKTGSGATSGTANTIYSPPLSKDAGGMIDPNG